MKSKINNRNETLKSYLRTVGALEFLYWNVWNVFYQPSTGLPTAPSLRYDLQMNATACYFNDPARFFHIHFLSFFQHFSALLRAVKRSKKTKTNTSASFSCHGNLNWLPRKMPGLQLVHAELIRLFLFPLRSHSPCVCFSHSLAV